MVKLMISHIFRAPHFPQNCIFLIYGPILIRFGIPIRRTIHTQLDGQFPPKTDTQKHFTRTRVALKQHGAYRSCSLIMSRITSGRNKKTLKGQLSKNKKFEVCQGRILVWSLSLKPFIFVPKVYCDILWAELLEKPLKMLKFHFRFQPYLKIVQFGINKY